MTYPAIPEGWERFRQDDMGRWEFQFPGVDNDAEWEMVDAIYCLAGITPESRLLWRDLCNAARCAWLDEAEREWCLKARPYYDNASHYHAACGDDTISYPKDIGISFDRDWCLAHAEAWAREAKGE